MENFCERALRESNEIAVHQGGVNGAPFWNLNSSIFMYVPSFYFPALPNGAADRFLFTATDKNGVEHTFIDKTPTALLTPIWSEIPVGLVTLKVEVIDANENVKYITGMRTFFKSSPFPGRENLPKRARSYKESAFLAFKYVFEQPMIKYWAEHGKPDPDYAHNVYPAKTISSVIRAMIEFAELSPENKEEAMEIAKKSADYLLSITYGEDFALCGLPPTYSFKGLNAEHVNKIAPAAEGCQDTSMMIYPAFAGEAYIKLFEATNDKKYFDAALKIANYYKENVLPNGSWYLQLSAKDGLPTKNNYCSSFAVLNFLKTMNRVTGGEEWNILADGYFNYIKKIGLDVYNWEGQFEDIPPSANYTNLTHINADDVIMYIVKNKSDSEELMESALDLMRFVEDQFVVWGEFAPWITELCPDVRSPAGMEQYYCYWPIDGSTAKVSQAFLSVYETTKEELYYEKAAALGDMLTRMQNPESGVIPTFWTSKENIEELENFWINCHIGSAFLLSRLAEISGEI